MWHSQSSGNMFVRVRWFYHPEETSKPNVKLIDSKVSSGNFEKKRYLILIAIYFFQNK